MRDALARSIDRAPSTAAPSDPSAPLSRPPRPRASFPPGRLVEISGIGAVARTTLAVCAVREAQERGETTAWIQLDGGPLYPPDLFENGVDLEALVVVLVPPSAGPYGMPKAAELLLRSGGFGLVVIDLSLVVPRGDMAWQGRLLALAREHAASILLLTRSAAQAGSLGSLVSMRIEPRRTRAGRGAFTVEREVLKNKGGDTASDTFLRDRLPSGPRRVVPGEIEEKCLTPYFRGPWGLS